MTIAATPTSTQPRLQPRIAPLAEPVPAAVAERLAKLLPPGMLPPRLFLSVARNVGLFNYLVDSGFIGPTGMLDRKTLAPELREAIILRVCVATANDYEFNLHVQTIAARMGLTPAQIEDVRRTPLTTALWNPHQMAALAMVDQMVATRTLPDMVYAAARELFSEEELIEITLLIGLYTSVAMLVGLIRPAFDRYRSEPVRTGLNSGEGGYW